MLLTQFQILEFLKEEADLEGKLLVVNLILFPRKSSIDRHFVITQILTPNTKFSGKKEEKLSHAPRKSVNFGGTMIRHKFRKKWHIFTFSPRANKSKSLKSHFRSGRNFLAREKRKKYGKDREKVTKLSPSLLFLCSFSSNAICFCSPLFSPRFNNLPSFPLFPLPT